MTYTVKYKLFPNEGDTMITLDITYSVFMKVTTGEGNEWMNKNVGEIVHDDAALSYGKGWRVYHTDYCNSWFVDFETEEHAMLFLLRWT